HPEEGKRRPADRAPGKEEQERRAGEGLRRQREVEALDEVTAWRGGPGSFARCSRSWVSGSSPSRCSASATASSGTANGATRFPERRKAPSKSATASPGS